LSDAVVLALLTAVGGGCLVVFKYLTGQIDFYRDRLFKSMDTTDDAVGTAEVIATKARKRAPGA
jgi:hypothetical protein